MSVDDQLRFEYLGNAPSSDVSIFGLIISSTIFNLFCYKVLPSKWTPLIKSYVVSTFHAVISVISVMYYFVKYEINFQQINRLVGGGVLGTGDEMMVYNICYSTGYLLYDLILMCVDQSVRSASAIVHHLIIVLSFLMGLITRVCHPCHFYFLAEEFSTIPLNLKTIYRHHHRVHQICSLLFVFGFFLSRLFYGSIICAYAFRTAPEFLRMTWMNDDLSTMFIGFTQAFFCLLTRGLNSYWAYLIVRKIFAMDSSEQCEKSSNRSFDKSSSLCE